eukprot:7845480-Heterocapsa_arctica.AAC.1
MWRPWQNLHGRIHQHCCAPCAAGGAAAGGLGPVLILLFPLPLPLPLPFTMASMISSPCSASTTIAPSSLSGKPSIEKARSRARYERMAALRMS